MRKTTCSALVIGLTGAAWLVGQVAGSDAGLAGPPALGERSSQSGSPERDGEPTLDDAAVEETRVEEAKVYEADSSEVTLEDTTISGGVASPILDAASRRLSFQALLTDIDGNPLSGPTVALEFRIYTAGGSLMDGPINMTVPISDGVVNVQIPVDPAAFNGASRLLGVAVGADDELSPRIPLTASPYAFRVDRVASAELDDDIELGVDGSATGSLRIWGAGGLLNLKNGTISEISAVNDSTFGASLSLKAFGATKVHIGAREWSLIGADGGSFMSLYNATSQSVSAIRLDADTTNAGGPALIRMANPAGEVTVRIESSESGTDGGRIALFQAGDEKETLELDSQESGGGSVILMYNSDPASTIATVEIDADEGGADAPVIRLRNTGGTITAELFGSELGDDGAELRLREADGHVTITLDAEHNLGDPDHPGGALVMFADSSGVNTIMLDANDDETGGGRLNLRTPSGFSNIWMEALDDTSGAGGLIRVRDGTRTTVRIRGKSGVGGGHIQLWNRNGQPTISIDGDSNGDGLLVTDVLQINGGSDLSERFNVVTQSGAVAPGMIVAIDPDRPGSLMISTRAYDTRVAGIVSGAGGVKTGLLMGQSDTLADGSHAVALTGRVYCLVDASVTPVRPGDLLTTSNTPGHAMKVVDHGRAHGAIVGKAMTGLSDGRGLVLVLVSLQ